MQQIRERMKACDDSANSTSQLPFIYFSFLATNQVDEGEKMERKPDSFISAEYVAIKSLTAPGNVTGDVNWTVSENNYFLL